MKKLSLGGPPPAHYSSASTGQNWCARYPSATFSSSLKVPCHNLRMTRFPRTRLLRRRVTLIRRLVSDQRLGRLPTVLALAAPLLDSVLGSVFSTRSCLFSLGLRV